MKKSAYFYCLSGKNSVRIKKTKKDFYYGDTNEIIAFFIKIDELFFL